MIYMNIKFGFKCLIKNERIKRKLQMQSVQCISFEYISFLGSNNHHTYLIKKKPSFYLLLLHESLRSYLNNITNEASLILYKHITRYIQLYP